MDHAWILLLSFLAIALFFSFLCSVLEAVLLSLTPSFIASQDGRFANALEKLKRDIDKPLAAILTLNTFAHTIGAAGVGAAAQQIWGEEALTLVSFVATILILICSEIIPKTIGAVYWRQLAKPVVTTTTWLTIILAPAVWFCQLITKMLRRNEEESILSRTDLTRVASMGHRDGLIREHERRIIENLMEKEDLQTQHVMTPMDRLVALPVSTPINQLTPQSKSWHVSRIPLYNDTVNNIIGYVLKDEVLGALLGKNGRQTMQQFKRPIVTVQADNTLVELYNELVNAHEHIAIVRNDKNETVGIVTMEDVLEELLGQEIVDESDLARGVLD